MANSHFATTERDISGWWKHLDPGKPNGNIEVKVDQALRGPGCTVTYVNLHQQPHVVSFERSCPTLLIYDATAYLNGERELDGMTARRSGPMGDRVDVIPAHTKFEGVADKGSRIGCTLVTIEPETDDGADETWSEMVSSLRPALGLRNRVVTALGERLRTFARSGMSGWSTAYLQGATSLLLHEICDELSVGQFHRRAEPRTGGLSTWAQRKICDYLQENLSQKVDLDALASHVGLSRFHFARAFKKTFGVPPCRYLMQLRITKATGLLRDTRTPITELALDLGFPTSAEFARAFRHAMNCTPREFRQRT
jgi:AraC-like DNA-binding protein